MTTHTLKTWPEYFDATARGDKTFEVRYNDRDFKVGDFLVLRKWDPITGKYTGVSIAQHVSYVFEGPKFGVQDGYVVLGVKLAETTEDANNAPDP